MATSAMTSPANPGAGDDMHTTTITRPDRAALENLWGEAGTWVADTWTRLNAEHFDGSLRYHGVVWGLTPHGGRLGHPSNPGGRITLHPALLDPRSDAWHIRDRLGMRCAEDRVLHEMIHVVLLARGIPNTESEPQHNTPEWCEEIMRITLRLGLPAIKAVPVKTRRVGGKVVRRELDGHLSRDAISRWPHTIRPTGYYTPDAGRIRVQI
jgi:hypothetical protein